jgi:hypothetical protein
MSWHVSDLSYIEMIVSTGMTRSSLETACSTGAPVIVVWWMRKVLNRRQAPPGSATSWVHSVDANSHHAIEHTDALSAAISAAAP